MIRLHLLGSLRLETARAGVRRSPLSQPRRAALLAYLALRARRGPERRDTLLGVFWPESDLNHARGALRNALHYLRSALGPGAIRSHGSDEVQVDLDLLWCDAVAFEQLCDAGDHAGALRLYAGDLLPGFFISEAPAFEQWLEAERQRLRQRAVDAARLLAAEAEAGGERHLAVLRLRHLLELTPTDEVATRRLMQLLTAADDRAGALRVFGELRERLNEYALEPAEETSGLAHRIRIDRAPAELPVLAAQGSAAEPETDTPEPAPPAEAPASRRSVSGLLAGAVAVTLAVAAVVLGLGRLPGLSSGRQLSDDLVAVLPFEYRGSAEHAYLREGLADLLAANLHGAGELQAVDPRALLPGLSDTDDPMPLRAAQQAAAAHGAALFVLGSIIEAGGQLRISAALYGTAPGAQLQKTDAVVEGAADDVLHLVDRLSVGLLQRRGTTIVAQAALRTTASVQALKYFLRGEAALRRLDVQSAVEHYRAATQIDSTFALAHYRLSSAAYRRGISGVPAPAAAAALRHAHRLVREDSLLVAAWHNHVSGTVTVAHQYYQQALHGRSSHVEAAFQLGELRFHWGATIGVPASEAREPFTRVLAAEPNNVEAALHLARLAARDGRPREVDSLFVRMQHAAPGGSWVREMEALRAFLGTDTLAQRRAIENAGSDADWILERMAAHTYNLAAVERLLRTRPGTDPSHAAQARAELFLTHVQLARGRYAEAARTIDNATPLPAARRLEYRAMMASLPFSPADRQESIALAKRLAAQPDMPLRAEGGPFSAGGIDYPHVLWPGMFRPRRLYLLGALHHRLGDMDRASAVADSLAIEARGEPFAECYERLTRATAAALAGLPSAALSTLGQPRQPPLPTLENFVDHGRPYERWLRAEMLRATGRYVEALRWYATFPDPMARDLAYLAPSHLRRGEILEATGNLREAAFHYARVVELWGGADEALQPEVRRARERLRALR